MICIAVLIVNFDTVYVKLLLFMTLLCYWGSFLAYLWYLGLNLEL